MIAGRSDLRGTAFVPVEMAQDTKRVSRFHLPQAGLLAKATLYLDSLGAGNGPAQVCRAILYDASDNLIARSDEVSIPAGAVAAWVDFSFSAALVSLPAADFYLGLHVGGYSNIIRMLGAGPHGMGGKWNADTYADGAAAVFGAATGLTNDYASYITTFASYVAPTATEVEDIYLARLPYGNAQQALSMGGPDNAPPRLVNVGWHDTFMDPETGSVALVREGSGFEDLIGERIRLTTQEVTSSRPVVAYVHDTAGEEAFDWDVSLARHAFAQIALLAEQSVLCFVKVVS